MSKVCGLIWVTMYMSVTPDKIRNKENGTGLRRREFTNFSMTFRYRYLVGTWGGRSRYLKI